MNILFFFAHPDDEAFGPAGTIAKLAQEHNVTVASMCNGARPGNKQVMKARQEAFEQSCKLLGAHSRINNYDDMEFEYRTAVMMAEHIVRAAQPEVVYTHHISDLNRDHRLIADATLVACRPKPESPVRELIACEVQSSSDWAFSQIEPTMQPNIYHDVTEFADVKQQALRLYETETYEMPDARSVGAVMARAQFRGSQVGVNYAEAFQLVFSRR